MMTTTMRMTTTATVGQWLSKNVFFFFIYVKTTGANSVDIGGGGAGDAGILSDVFWLNCEK